MQRLRLVQLLVPPPVTDALGDALAQVVSRGEPEFLGLSLYLWKVERSLHLAREVKKCSPATRVLVGGREVSSDNDSEAVCFADWTLERAWQTEMLGCMRHRPIAVTLRRPAW